MVRGPWLGIAARRRGLWRSAAAYRQDTASSSVVATQDSVLLRFTRAAVLDVDGLLPGGAQGGAGQHGAAAAGLPGGGIASREAGFAGHAGGRTDA